MALTNGKGRLVSDPSIGVSDLMASLQDYMQTRNSRDLELILEIPRGTSWKTAINCEWLATVSSLFQGYAKVAPNTMLPPKKHRAALAQLRQEGKINFSRKSDADFFDYVDEMLRVCFSQFRQLAQSPDACERAFRKASPIQVKAIEGVLSMLTVGKEKVAALVAQEEGGVCGQDSAPTLVMPGALNKCVSSEECLAVVPAEAPAPRPKQPASFHRMKGLRTSSPPRSATSAQLPSSKQSWQGLAWRPWRLRRSCLAPRLKKQRRRANGRRLASKASFRRATTARTQTSCFKPLWRRCPLVKMGSASCRSSATIRTTRTRRRARRGKARVKANPRPL